MSSEDPLRLFQEDLKDDDLGVIQAAVDRVTSIAILLGPARTRSELLPFLTEFLETDSDEAHASIAKQLGDFVELIGGSAHLQNILPLLEKLAGEEEHVIRENAVDSINKVILAMPKSEIGSKIVPFLKRLANGDWFTTRVSATGIFPVLYPLVPEFQQELRSLFSNLCQDDTPMVRKAAYAQMGRMCMCICLGGLLPPYNFPSAPSSSSSSSSSPSSSFNFLPMNPLPSVPAASLAILKSDLLPLVKGMATDDSDVMRLFTVDTCVYLSRTLGLTQDPQTDLNSILLPLAEGLADDNSWRVRQTAANHWPEMCLGVSLIPAAEPFNRKLLPCFVKFLKDKEGEVRSNASEKLSEFSSVLRIGQSFSSPSNLSSSSSAAASSSVSPFQAQFIELIVPILEQLAVDPVGSVRLGFARSLIGLSNALGKDQVGKTLVPLLQQLSKDENSDVRNCVLQKLDVLTEAVGQTSMTTIVLPSLLELAKDPKWRVRHAVIQQSASLSIALGQKNWEKRILPLLLAALSDHVCAVREEACSQLGLVVKEYGGRWAAEKLFPPAFTLYKQQANYLHRLTCLVVVSATAAHSGAEVLEKTHLPLVLTACTDEVPNVRVGAARTLAEIIPKLDKKLVESKVKPVLQKMMADNDSDVSFFSAQAFKLCG